MSLILITGPAASGKSTIASELNGLGYEAYDTEEDNISGWFNIETGRQKPTPRRMSQAWHSKHIWLIDTDRIQKMSEGAKNKTIILCGLARNIDQILDFCDKVIWLKMDDVTIRERVSLPTRRNGWSRKPYQLEFTLSRNKMLEKDFKERGAIIIDATKSLPVVLKNVLVAIQ